MEKEKDENLEKLMSLSTEEVDNIFSQLSANEIEELLETISEEDPNGND